MRHRTARLAIRILGCLHAAACTKAPSLSPSVLSISRRVACWGFNAHGQLGRGSTTAAAVPELLEVTGPGSVKSPAVGGFHTCARAADGAGPGWGSNSHSQPGPALSLLGVVRYVPGS